MADIPSRLMGCFGAVFPALSPDEILRADHSNVGQWDSVASVTLFATIEEEFGVELELDELPRLVSFAKILSHLESRTTA